MSSPLATALLGLAVAGRSVFLGHAFDNPYLDGVASLVTGLILVCTATLLAYESKGLLIGEGADPDVLRRIQALVQADPAVYAAHRPLTIHLGPK
jgi:divalent metal cation (Fe/Co/Zn/Cd) transporter